MCMDTQAKLKALSRKAKKKNAYTKPRFFGKFYNRPSAMWNPGPLSPNLRKASYTYATTVPHLGLDFIQSKLHLILWNVKQKNNYDRVAHILSNKKYCTVRVVFSCPYVMASPSLSVVPRWRMRPNNNTA